MVAMRYLYDVAIRLYFMGIKVAAPFHPKARQWIAGRKSLFPDLEEGLRHRRTSSKLMWIHCASLGEFEQARPVIERLRQAYPASFLLLSFYS
ncbi:MAG TPA: 3-deoxy-D-manno-octulosonic acid transferase, partial [Phaeodactylibacter sp.]|nr:3-deoxy-D-manno-octulosonic acid transferase [Phaeodactylibacter sp.]